MITHTKKATFIAALEQYESNGTSRYFASWDLYRCEVTGLFFKFGHEGERGRKVRDRRGGWTVQPDDPPHRVYLRKRSVVHALNFHANDI